jgi:peptidoglycan/xylan/chitin deacetylase (PgdA/CDA1 family)
MGLKGKFLALKFSLRNQGVFAMGRSAGLLCTLALAAAASAAVAPVAPAQAAAVTVVSIQFDDGNVDQNTARDALAAHGMHATFYVNSGSIDTADHLSWAQLTALAADGHEITGHTVDHVNLKKLKAVALQHQVCDDRAALQAHGFAAISFAYPFGGFDAQAKQAVAACGYTSGRGVSGVDGRRTFAETLPPADAYATRTPANVKSGTTLATIQSYITGAEAHGGGWVQLVFHHVCDHCDAYSVTLEDFGALLDWLAARQPQGTVVLTTAEAMALTP